MKLHSTLAAICAAALPAVASAAPILQDVTGAAFDAEGTVIGTIAQALSLAQGEPDATFDVTAVDYPPGSTATSADTLLSDFLGVDGTSLQGTDFTVSQSVLVITGQVLLSEGAQTFTVASDDGFRLTIGGMLISEFASDRRFGETSATMDAGVGLTTFTLVYFDNLGDAGLRFSVDGEVATAITGEVIPLPGALALMLPALGAGTLLRLRRD